MELTFSFDTDADDRTVAKLLELTERYCVVAQTVSGPVPATIRRG